MGLADTAQRCSGQFDTTGRLCEDIAMAKSQVKGSSCYARHQKRPYDYSHLFKDRSENERYHGHFLWTNELKPEASNVKTV